MLIIKRITNGKFCRYFSESSEIVHFLIVLLIIFLYRQNHQRIEKSSVLFDGFLKNFDLISIIINILYKFVFFSLLSFTCNYIKVRFFFFLFFFMFFSLYLFFVLFLNFFILNNCMKVVVGFLSVNLSVIIFFLLPTDKKLSMKDSPIKYFRL